MKILRKGTLPKNTIYNGVCRNCNCQVEVPYNEVRQRDLGGRYSGEFIEYSIPCPTVGCGHTIILMEKPTPASEMDKAFESLFGDDAPKPKPNVISITEGLAKKEDCKCGIHRKSELIRRMKKLPGIREKTISDLYDELFQ